MTSRWGQIVEQGLVNRFDRYTEGLGFDRQWLLPVDPQSTRPGGGDACASRRVLRESGCGRRDSRNPKLQRSVYCPVDPGFSLDRHVGPVGTVRNFNSKLQEFIPDKI